MNEYQYEELFAYIKNIGQFKELVSLESKRPIAVRTLMHVANVDKSTAWDFVNEYYDRTDLYYRTTRIENAMGKSRI